MINTLSGKTQNLEIMADTLLHNAYRMASQLRVNFWMKGKMGLGTVKEREGMGGRERETENLHCGRPPQLSGVQNVLGHGTSILMKVSYTLHYLGSILHALFDIQQNEHDKCMWISSHS